MWIYAFSLNPYISGWVGAIVVVLIVATVLVLSANFPKFMNYLEKHSSIVREIREHSRERKNRTLD